MPYVVLSHTADTGLEATAETLADLVRELATGMFGLMALTEPGAAHKWVEVSIAAPTPEELVVDALSELLYQSEVADVIFCAVEVEPAADGLTIKAGGVPVAEVDPTGPPIKAVTYHDLAVEERPEGWFGRVYFDV